MSRTHCWSPSKPAHAAACEIVLAFVGLKMLVSSVFPIPIGISLGVIAALLGGSIVASLMFPRQADVAHLRGPHDIEDVADGIPDPDEPGTLPRRDSA